MRRLVAWCFAVYLGLVGKLWVRIFAASVAFVVRFVLETGRKRFQRNVNQRNYIGNRKIAK